MRLYSCMTLYSPAMRIPFTPSALALMLLGGSLQAQTITWTGASGNLLFDNDANWSSYPDFNWGRSNLSIDVPVVAEISANGPASGYPQAGDLSLTNGAGLNLTGGSEYYGLHLTMLGALNGPQSVLHLSEQNKLVINGTSGSSSIGHTTITLDLGSELHFLNQSVNIGSAGDTSLFIGQGGRFIATNLQLGGGSGTTTLTLQGINSFMALSGIVNFGGTGGTTRIIMGSAVGEAPTSTGYVLGVGEHSPIGSNLIGSSGSTNEVIFNHTQGEANAAIFLASLNGIINVIHEAGVTRYNPIGYDPYSPTFSGSVTVNGGHLVLDRSLGDAIVVINGGELTAGGRVKQVTLNSGGLLTNDTTVTQGSPRRESTEIEHLILNGGEVRSIGSANFWNIERLTVTGSSASVFTVGAPGLWTTYYNNNMGPAGISPVRLGADSTAPKRLTFDVGNVTNSPAADLTLNVRLADSLTPGGTSESIVTKTGAGTLVLTQEVHIEYRYIGSTHIEAGTLVSNGHGNDNSRGTMGRHYPNFSAFDLKLYVHAGATLAGDDLIDQTSVFHAGAHLAQGSPVGLNTGRPQDLLTGTLTFKNGLTMETGAILDFDLGLVSDRIRVIGGTLTGPSGGTITVNLTDSGGFTAGVYTLIDASGATLSSIGATTFTLGSAIDGYAYAFSQEGLAILLTATAIPEPSACAILAGTAALGLASLRRRRPAA